MDATSNPNTVAREFTIQRQGKTVVLFAGLLDLAHRQGLRAIRTRLVQIPTEDNGQTAICTAEVETERGSYSGIGDASPANVARPMLTCTIRMAETRAKARALRDAVNVAVVSLEELDGDELLQDAQVMHQVQPTRATAPPPAPRPPAIADAKAPPARAVAASAPAAPSSRAEIGGNRPAVASVDRASSAQLQLIDKLTAEAGIPSEGLLKLCAGYGFASPEAATKSQASKLIDLLRAKAASH